MPKPVLLALASVWRRRALWLPPVLLVPLVLVFITLAQGTRYTAVATLQAETGAASSPLLSTLGATGQAKVLTSTLQSPALLDDVARESGVRFIPDHLSVEVLNGNLIRLTAQHYQRAGLERGLDSLAYAFILDLLAPERLRLEQRLQGLQSHLGELNASLSVPGLTALARQELEIKQRVATQALTRLTEQVAGINAAFAADGNPQAVLWFAEPARVLPGPSLALRLLQSLALGVLAGAGVGLLLMALRRFMDDSVADVATLAALTNLPSLGVVPNLGHVQLSPTGARVQVGSTSLNPEEFTEITRLHRAITRGTHGSFALTSAAGQEGTSLLTALLALKSAASGKKTLLIDLNLKSGSLTTALGLAAQSWHTGKKGKDKASYQVNDLGEAWHGLHLLPLPAGAETLAALSTPQGLHDALEALRTAYDHVWLDTTPIKAANRGNIDPLSIAAAATRTALVVKLGHTPAALVQAAAAALGHTGAHLHGVVANAVACPGPKTQLLELAGFLKAILPGTAAKLRAATVRADVEA